MGNKNRLPNAFNLTQLNKIFDVIDRPKLAIAVFLSFFCGLRIEEVCKLRIEDIDLESKRLKIVDSKNPNRSLTGYGKDRYVPIPTKAISPLQKWIEIIGIDSKWLLPSMTSPDQHLRKKSLYEQFREVLQRANLLIPNFTFSEKTGKQKVRHMYYFHTLRHSYATYLLSKGVDIYTISNLMGHNQVTTTQIYARINTTQQKQAVEEAFNSPLMEFRPNHRQHLLREPVQQDQSIERIRLEVERNRIELEKMKLMREQVIIQREI